jgi:hypothetical protein
LDNKKVVIYLILFSLVFGACQKEYIIGDKEYKILGSSARDLLTSSPYSLLKIEIDYMPGYAPDTTSVNKLVIFLNSYLNKPSGIQVFQHQISASDKTVLSLADIVSLEKRNRNIYTENNVVAVHILITNGDYSEPNILATSYWNTSFCIFGKTVENNSGGIGQISRASLTATLFEHEFGHLLGLVGQGSPMQKEHRDLSNGAHCSNPFCLMYADVETSSNGNTGNNIPSLDADCISDLKANGGK